MTTTSELEEIRRGIEKLVELALEAATTLEEVVDCAQAAASLGNRELLERVAHRLGAEVASANASSGAWEAELTYSKIDAWQQTGHRARLLAEAWRHIGPQLLTAPTPARTDRI